MLYIQKKHFFSDMLDGSQLIYQHVIECGRKPMQEHVEQENYMTKSSRLGIERMALVVNYCASWVYIHNIQSGSKLLFQLLLTKHL